MNMFTLAGSAARKDGTMVTYSQRCEVTLTVQNLSLGTYGSFKDSFR